MPSGPTHRVETVPLRTIWPREQQDFSQWLVDNIDFLNDHLPFDIDPESLGAEQSAGAFSVDVVGEAIDPDSTEPVKVIIENQLEQTDHDHLGKLLTYLSAFDATAAIWISAKARPEHAKAVQWLNDESSIDAWLFDVGVIRIADSPAAPLLTQIIGPSALSKKAKAEKQASQAERQEKMAFWAAVFPAVAGACRDQGVWQARTPRGNVNAWQSVPNGTGRIGWEMWVTHHGSWICLRIDGHSPAEVTHYFTELLNQRDAVDAEFGDGLRWEWLEGYRTSMIRWDNPMPGGYRDDPDQWEPVAESLADAMNRLVAATAKPVAALTPYEAPDGEVVEDSPPLSHGIDSATGSG